MLGVERLGDVHRGQDREDVGLQDGDEELERRERDEAEERERHERGSGSSRCWVR